MFPRRRLRRFTNRTRRSVHGACQAIRIAPPEEAAHALLKMLDMMELEQMAEARLGTCVPAVHADHPGQVACTVVLKIGAGTSETQADFHHDGKEWIAQPSQSQDQLPFPDPNL